MFWEFLFFLFRCEAIQQKKQATDAKHSPDMF